MFFTLAGSDCTRLRVALVLLALALPATNGLVAAEVDVKANGSDGPLTISPGGRLTVTVAVDPGPHARVRADWWLLADTPMGWFHYEFQSGSWRPGSRLTYQGPLFLLPETEVLDAVGLPRGVYTVHGGVDRVPNGSIDMEAMDHDSVVVEVADAEVWSPAPGTSWQLQLSGEVDTSFDVEMYDIDLFDVPQGVIDELHGDGRIVICYFSAGSWEDWRPDAALFPPEVLGKDLDGWPGEKWLDIRRIDLLAPVMRERMDLAVRKGCDGVDPDNVDGYTNDSGFPLTYQDQIDYNVWLSAEAHGRGLAIGLKNDLDQVEDLVAHFEWALNEQCFQFEECGMLLPFVNAGKAVFGVEYEGDPAVFCPALNARQFSWLKKNLDLDAWRVDCHDYSR